MKKSAVLGIIALAMLILFVGCTSPDENIDTDDYEAEDVGTTETNVGNVEPDFFDVALTYENGTLYTNIVIGNDFADVLEVRQHIILAHSVGGEWHISGMDQNQNLPIVIQPGTKANIELAFRLDHVPLNQIESFRLQIMGESGMFAQVMKYEIRLTEDDSGNMTIETIEKSIVLDVIE